MTNIEISELLKNNNMYEIARKTCTPTIALSEEEGVIASQLDEHFKEIGRRGFDEHREISAFIEKVVNDEIYNAPDELLDDIFDRGTIGTADDFSAYTTPKNTLIAYEAAKGGNVNRSYLDANVLAPTWKNFQIDTEISFADIAKNGWKTVALYTDYAVTELKNKMFTAIFDALDAAITSGSGNYISESTTAPTAASLDALALYVQDRAGYGNGKIVARSKYIQTASKLTGFVSDEMINEVHRTGKAGVYDGVEMVPISSAKKLGNGSVMIPDKRMFGIAGKIGTLNMKGDIHIYQTEDNSKEKFVLFIKDCTFGYAFNANTLENVCKMTIA